MSGHVPRPLAAAAALFDRAELAWTNAATERFVGTVIVAVFIAGLAVIQANRIGWLPAPLATRVSTNHFHAVTLAFVLVLLAEIVGLVFSLGRSVSISVGMQFEVLSLILLRQTFKQLAAFSEPVHWQHKGIGPMLADAGGALVVFLGLVLYYRLQHHRPITPDAGEHSSFVASKKLVGLLLFASILCLGAATAWRAMTGGPQPPFFDSLYTVLIFSDVLIVLVAQRAASSYPVVFRNSGFAVSTVFMRLSLTADPYLDAILGVVAVGFACGVTFAYNRFPEPPAEAGGIPSPSRS